MRLGYARGCGYRWYSTAQATSAAAQVSDVVSRMQVPPDFLKTQRLELDLVAQYLGVKKHSDWYGISSAQVRRTQAGRNVVDFYRSLRVALANVYPDHQWDGSKFAMMKQANRNAKKDEALLKALDGAEKQIGITQPEDWLTVKLEDLRNVGISTHYLTKPKLAELLGKKYPSIKWDSLYLMKGRFSQERRFQRVVQSLFASEDIRLNVRKDSGLVDPVTGSYLELDVYIPSLRIAFEYQELHHYSSVGYHYQPLRELQELDQMKIKLAEQLGVDLLVIPFWWDGTKDSLAATIRMKRPDLLKNYLAKGGVPIPQKMPDEVFKKTITNVEGIGDPISARFFTLANVNPQGWWVFEKYDGVRGFWNPEKKAMYSRSGKVLRLPNEIIDAMPSDMFLDGELWFGRDNFQEAIKMSSKAAKIDWTKFKFMVFDLPKHSGNYQQRYTALEEYIKESVATSPYLKYVELARWQQCQDTTHLQSLFQDILDQGGEGIILRDPNSPQQSGRSSGYLKHKKFRDAEARIVSHVQDLRWECELPNGVKFEAYPDNMEFARRHSLKKGDIVSFKHRGFLASFKPKFPTIHRIRSDLTWDDVVNNWNEHKHASKVVPLDVKGRTRTRRVRWREGNKVKQFLLNYAQWKGFDPMHAENWKGVTLADLRAYEPDVPATVWPLTRTLKKCFPALKTLKPKTYWMNLDNRRKFFTSFAEEMQFDPSSIEGWQRVSTADVIAKKGPGPLPWYGDSLEQALRQTYSKFAAAKDKLTADSRV